MTRWLFVLIATALLIIVGSVANASIPDGSGVIHACYKANKGLLRVVDSAQACESSGSSVSSMMFFE